MQRKSELVFVWWIALVILALKVSNSDANECECLVGNAGCTASCLCNRTLEYFPFVPAEDNCRTSDNSSLSSLGQTTPSLTGSYTFRSALTATKITSPTNEELLVSVWHATNGGAAYDQIIGSISSRNGTIISGSQPFPVSDLARSTNPTISKRITAQAISNGFVVVWAEGTSTATATPLKARCFSASGSPLSTVQTLSGTSSFMADQVRYSAVVYGSGTKLALYWTWYGEKKTFFATYSISASGVISVATSAKQVSNNPKPEVSSREIRQDYLQAYESGSTTTFMLLVEDLEADYAQSTLSVSILNDQASSILGLTQLGNTNRAYPGAMVTVISDKYVVLWNDPGNLEFSAVRGCTYNPVTGAAGGVFDFWSTSNTTDMAMDLIPISSSALLFGHTRLIARPLTQVCYQVVSWDGTNIPQTVSSDKTVCVEGSFGSPETSAVTWNNGQVTTFWTDTAFSGGVTQSSQVRGLVDLSELGLAPISAPASLETPSASPADQNTPIPNVEPPASAPIDTSSIVPGALQPTNNEDGVIAGVVIGVGAALGGGTLLLVLMLKRRKTKEKSAELTQVKVLTTDNEEGKYISLPSAVAMHNYAIPKQKIQLKQQIASGSFGAVFAATYNNTPVAVKVHQSNMLSTDDFLNEANLALSIKPHPNVLVTHGVTQLDENTIGLVMEYCAGGSLWSQIKDHPPHSKQQVLDMLVSIASGLEHLHANGIIHRDVAARNVLITAEGHLKLADFGMSRKLKEGDGSKTNQTIGPAASMAPESIRDGMYSKKSDVWMFGIMIYEILSGKKPHGSAENLVSVAIDIRETGRIPRLDDHVDEFFKQLMLKCCQFEPEQRPDFEQIIQELNEEKQRMNEQS